MIHVDTLRVRYASALAPTLENLSFDVPSGSVLLVAGPSGCGKSTLLQAMGGLLHHESSVEINGEVLLGREPISSLSLTEITMRVGMVFQNPDAQICTATVFDEVAFALQNHQISSNEIDTRIQEALQHTGLEGQLDAASQTLSGGQKQRLALACALAIHPDVLFLDEPLSQLDPQGAGELLETLRHLNHEMQMTMVLAEHRLDDVIAFSDHVLILNNGKTAFTGSREDFLNSLEIPNQLRLRVPLLPDLFSRCGRRERPLTLEDAPLLTEQEIQRISLHDDSTVPASSKAESICSVSNLSFTYPAGNAPVLADVNLALHPGDRIALMGTNGCGKSTLLHLLGGILTPSDGSIDWASPETSIGLVLQDPDVMLYSQTVFEELSFGPIQQGIASNLLNQRVVETMSFIGLNDFAQDAPFSLSRGQRLRAALGSVLTLQPDVLLLDEPTTGQDQEQIDRMMEGLAEHCPVILFCTHDLETTIRYATRVIVLGNQGIAAEGDPESILEHPQSKQLLGEELPAYYQYLKRVGLPVTFSANHIPTRKQ